MCCGLGNLVSGNRFGWEERYKIALGVAEALDSLHNTAETIIHRDVKSSNILLSDDFEPQVFYSCFDLCNLFVIDFIHVLLILMTLIWPYSCRTLGLLLGHQAVRMIWIPLMLLEHLGESYDLNVISTHYQIINNTHFMAAT